MTIPAQLLHVAHHRPNDVALRFKALGLYRELTWSTGSRPHRTDRLGVRRAWRAAGDRVAIVGDPLPDWLLTDFAVQCVGAISFGLYPTSSREEMQFVLRNGGATVLVAEDQEHVDKVLPVVDRLPGLRKIVVIDDSNMFAYQHPALMSLRELVEQERWPRARRFHPTMPVGAPRRSGDHRLHLRHQRKPKGRRLHPPRLGSPGLSVLRISGARGPHRRAQRRASAAQPPV